MASHRKPRSRIPASLTGHSRRTAVGFTTAALASVTLLSQSANAAPTDPKPAAQSIEKVKEKVDTLYHQAETATQRYNAAKERTDQQRAKVDKLLDSVARRTEKLNEARRMLGAYATAQYREGGMARSAATLLFSNDPQDVFDQSHLMDRMTGRQKQAVDDFQKQRVKAAKERGKAGESLASLTASQKQLKVQKKTVQDKLTEARRLLANLTAKEKARLAAIEKKKAEEARRKAAELAEKQRQEAAARKKQQEQNAGDSGSTAPSTPSVPANSSKAAQAIAFAKAQLGKPYVWGATGPSSFDCSGLTQAAWKSAGISLPRTTWDQVKAGTRVSTSQLQPGDLVFFYDDISHVGLYIGDGMMIHAPKPGDVVKKAPITEMPIYGSVRPS
ncbi:C40 family peptidase [Streptomyces rapamycinicus]|uniref:Glycoside hydrolase n=2 Tax=Streptomyces rapamycinicus TaxID=1226757 RepID=A0A0A0NJI5_STRRN|nr:NlpC/P60 family protein [Streptomyces rapamycinicus]AGP57134.1 glycoside hydrolase [Streptomyces rapamycinicus NRRL 5491]MBB4784771.1 cell wall-associated NlpC family hydrolase [Streptomyces rapamycinicus]RLV79751.1 glycoside hydrolase [Streptomyces rapamycinicus NRRL 5491]UTO65029.1 NlpC/P60 family protein [Streptomyces rapamycinicus]UTP32985.1 NlpC/P60 family protein [Streptomyces rapamycinicus NRRL 5491]